MGDVAPGHAAGVEDPHRQLGAGLADGLGGHDADGFALLDQLPGRAVKAIAVAADAFFGLAGEDRADLDLGDAGFLDLLGLLIAYEGVLADDDLAGVRVDDVVHGEAPGDAVGELHDDGVAAGVADFADDEAVVAVAVVLADDDVLGDVD